MTNTEWNAWNVSLWIEENEKNYFTYYNALKQGFIKKWSFDYSIRFAMKKAGTYPDRMPYGLKYVRTPEGARYTFKAVEYAFKDAWEYWKVNGID